MTVHEVSEMTGVSIRALHHYDRIGLLHATRTTDAGYRLYDDAALERLQQILLFRELEFSLKEIGTILDSPAFDRDKALEQQIRLLELRRKHLEDLIGLAREIQTGGSESMHFDAFDTKEIDEYAAQAKASWGQTDAWREYEKKSAGRTRETQMKLNDEMMGIFREFGTVRKQAPDSPKAAALVRKLQAHITGHYYNCTDELLLSLGQMYAGGGRFTENIDRAGGEGTAVFVNHAIIAEIGRKRK